MRDGHAILPTFLQVSGQFEVATCSQVLSPTTLFIHFCLASLNITFHATIIHQMLQDYFPHGGLDVLEVPFQLGAKPTLEEYTHHTQALAEGLSEAYEYIMILLTNHSNNNTGGLFIGLNSTGHDAATPVDKVSSFIWSFICETEHSFSSWMCFSLHLRNSSPSLFYILLAVVQWSKSTIVSRGFVPL
jgi:hypothetical protein